MYREAKNKKGRKSAIFLSTSKKVAINIVAVIMKNIAVFCDSNELLNPSLSLVMRLSINGTSTNNRT